jgi:indolepyruvate ferredoxin oxidoreductase alpha subunit
MKDMRIPLSGAYALAEGAIEAGVSLVTGYPGAPTTAVVDAILARTTPGAVRVEWTSNEKVAVEVAFGASVAGRRALLAVKSVGLNIALDPLMAMNLSGCNAGFVVLVGDDPGGWGSQNEQDSRVLAQATELPMLEPTSVSQARASMRQAFALSEQVGLPVLVRVTRALVSAQGELGAGLPTAPPGPPPAFRREFMQWVVLPINVVPYHDRLCRRLDQVQSCFERLALNGVEGEGVQGVIAAGFAYQKLLEVLGGSIPPALRVLRLGTFHPMPAGRVTAFLQDVEAALVLEETLPLVERAVRAAAQPAGLALSIYGRDTGHVPRGGELFAREIATALNRAYPVLALPTEGQQRRPMPSRQSLCEDCPYGRIFDALVAVIERVGERDNVIVVGDPGCMVRAQMPPYELMDIKNSLGSAIGMAAGVALSGTGKRVVALCGDSGFLHSGLNALMDAARVGARMLLVILDNGTTALSGGQPHPGSPVDARGRPQRAVHLAALAREAGAGQVRMVDLDAGEDVFPPLEEGIACNGLAVVVARGQCRRHPEAR